VREDNPIPPFEEALFSVLLIGWSLFVGPLGFRHDGICAAKVGLAGPT
jgi:hypothetical protein